MICSSVNRFFTSNLLRMGIGLQTNVLLKSEGASEQLSAELIAFGANSRDERPPSVLIHDTEVAALAQVGSSVGLRCSASPGTD